MVAGARWARRECGRHHSKRITGAGLGHRNDLVAVGQVIERLQSKTRNPRFISGPLQTPRERYVAPKLETRAIGS